MEYGQGSFLWNEASYPMDKAHIFSHQEKQIYLGLPQWGSPEWKGHFYTKSCPPKDFLKQYSLRLNTVEVSSTFYSSANPTQLEKWSGIVPDHFRFLPKWPQEITHHRQLESCKELSLQFMNSLKSFGDKLGVSILQLPPSFSRRKKKELFYFIKDIPDDFPLAIEFRHASWFEDQRVYKELENYLSSRNISMVLSDTPALRNIFHLSFTGPNTVIRYLSDHNDSMDQKRLNHWSSWLEDLQQGGNFYFVIHRSENALAPTLIPYFSEELHQTVQQQLNQEEQPLFDLLK